MSLEYEPNIPADDLGAWWEEQNRLAYLYLIIFLLLFLLFQYLLSNQKKKPFKKLRH